MSQLRATATRPERREGGRHGRPVARSGTVQTRATPRAGRETRIRPQLLRTAVLPAIVASLSGAAAVVTVLSSAAVEPGAGAWTALAGTALVALASVAVAALGAERTARSVIERCHELRRTSARGQEELRTVVDRLRRGERVAVRRTPPVLAGEGDELDRLARELTRSHETAVGAVVQASRLSSSAGNEQKVEVFVNLARRLQSLVHREIQLLDELENEVEDPELLRGLFHIDHLATRIRRHAENLAVLGGAVSRRQWSSPVTVTEVLRSAVAEVEQYPRVTLVPPIEGTLRGHAVADVIHLLAELIENATLFSAPQTQVLVHVQRVTAGLAVEVEDRGLGMPRNDQRRMNALLADPDQVSVAHLLQDGRIGLFVVSALARRHGIAVRLQSNIYGGVQAVLVVPEALLGAEGERTPARGTSVPGTAGTAKSASGPSAAPPAPRGAAAVPQRVAVPEPTAPVPSAVTPSAATTAPPLPRAAQDRPPTRSDTAERGPDRPRLPKRRSQEHLVPQLREPARPVDPAGEPTLHDPGLMAAFRRGIDLAETDEPDDHEDTSPETDTGNGVAPGPTAPAPPHPPPRPDLPQRGLQEQRTAPRHPQHRGVDRPW